MIIKILQGTAEASAAEGLTVVIDVFRAFSTACYLFNAGIEVIYPVEKVEDAVALKQQLPNALLLGERHEKKVPGFDFGNSPTHIAPLDLKGKSLIMTTSSGTRGIYNATGASQIITGSFVNADSIVAYIRREAPEVVSLLCMGYEGHTPTQEDTFLAQYVAARLEEKEVDFEAMKLALRSGDGARLLDPANAEWSPASDFELCLHLNHFDFVLKLTQMDGINALQPVAI